MAKKKTIDLSLRLPPEVHEKLRGWAFDKRVSMNSVAIEALTLYFIGKNFPNVWTEEK